MKVNQDTKELLISYVSTFIECYKVFIACLLVVFVPQYCEKTKTTCTFYENFSDLTMFNEFVLTFNFLTLAFFIYTYYVQSKRETYFITHLEINKNLPDNNLEKSLENYQKIFNRVTYYNNLIYKYSIFSSIVFYINTLFSSILIFHYYYDGFRSVTTLITSVLLVSQKLYQLYSISYDCRKNIMSGSEKPELALSLVRLEPISFNDVDPNYRTSNKGQSRLSNLNPTIEITQT